MQKKCEIKAKFLVYFLVLAAVLVSAIAQLGQLGVPGESQQSACGNGICEDGETSRTCSHDCKERVCPDVCVEMWQLSGNSCTFKSCGSGCGPDSTITFKDEVECRLRLAGPKCSDFSAEECARHDNCQTVSVRKGGQRCIDFVKCAENEQICKQIDCPKLLNNKLECLVYDKCEYTGGKCVDKLTCPAYAPPYCPDGRLVDQGKDENGCPNPPKCELACGNNICEVGECKEGEKCAYPCPQDCGKECPQGFVPGCPIVECIEGYTSVQNPITCCYECKKIAECKTDADCPQLNCIMAPCPQYSCINEQCVQCPIPECAAPPDGCSYEGGRDEKGCPTCGKLVCEKPICGNNICEVGECKEGEKCRYPCPQDCQQKEIEVKVPSSFSLAEGQTAKVVNYQNIQIKLNQIIENVQAVGAGGKIPPPPPPSTIAKITVSSSGGCGPNADPGCLGPPGFSKDYVIPEGESIDVQGLKITFSGVEYQDSITGTQLARFKISSSENEHCALKPDSGICKAMFPRYYFDQAAGICKEFIWGGCGGTVPFETLEKCQASCERPVCGNNVCEEGEAEDCPPCVNAPPYCDAPCTVGTCPQDCQKCAQENEFCGGIAGFACCSELTCKVEGDYPDAGGSCVTERYLCVNTCGDGVCQERVCLGPGCPCEESSQTCKQDCCPTISPPLQKEGCTYSRNLDEKGCIVGYEERCETPPQLPRCNAREKFSDEDDFVGYQRCNPDDNRCTHACDFEDDGDGVKLVNCVLGCSS